MYLGFFKLEEFVPRTIYNQYGNSAIWFIRPELQQMANGIRRYFNRPMIINDWCFRKAGFVWRGYRTPTCNVGTKLSQHKMGCAIDFNIEGIPSDEVHDVIMSNQKEFYQMGVRAIENKKYTPTWTHVDCRNMINTGDFSIKVVQPT